MWRKSTRGHYLGASREVLMAVQGLSIQVKLPLLIGGLLVAGTGIYSWAAYQTVRRSTVTAVASRLGTVVDQLAGTLQASRDQLLATARAVADSAAVRAYALQPGDSRRAAAQAALRPSGAQAQQIAATAGRRRPGGRRAPLGAGGSRARTGGRAFGAADTVGAAGRVPA